MKRFLAITSAILVLSVSLTAQSIDIHKMLEENPDYLYGTDNLCPSTEQELTAAPKGYKPFYLSMYSRHGARYAWQPDMYDRLNEVFGNAAREDNLTDLGKSFKERFDLLFPSVRYRAGELSSVGWEQMQGLSKRMYANFPEVFTDGADVDAYTSTSTRCVMTMSSFCLGLKGESPKIDLVEHFGKIYLPAILPQDSSNPYRVTDFKKAELLLNESYENFIERKVNYRAVLARLFKDVEKDVPAEKQWDLVSYLYYFANGMQSLDTTLDFSDILTFDEKVAIWETDCFQFYMYAWPTHPGYRPIVDDIITKADEQIASGKNGADLRFGHDYTFLPLLMLLNVNGFGQALETGEQTAQFCRTNDVPMGANLQFVFYKSKKNPEILFKVLFNGKEAHLPVATDKWPYYSWEDFKAYEAL